MGETLKCARCGFDDTKVLESRLSSDGRSIRRRRQCRQCDARITTYEKEETQLFYIRKKDGRLEPYDRDKVLRSIQIACRKRDIRLEQMEFLLARVEAVLAESGERIVSSRRLGELILEGLGELDAVAYVRFASVYQDFKDPIEFYSILRSLRDKDLERSGVERTKEHEVFGFDETNA